MKLELISGTKTYGGIVVGHLFYIILDAIDLQDIPSHLQQKSCRILIKKTVFPMFAYSLHKVVGPSLEGNSTAVVMIL